MNPEGLPAGRPSVANWFYFVAGIGFLALAKAKHVLYGYSTPKPFGLSELDRCIDYDVDSTVSQLAKVVRPGGKIVAVIDLQTHSRWIREKDPNNIYRYPRWLYRLFYFPGQPNRVRPAQYRACFERHGWRDVAIAATKTFDARGRSVHRDFRGCQALDACSILLCATRGE